MSDKPRGYFDKVIAIDTETTGVFFGSTSPAISPNFNGTGKTARYQIIEIALIVLSWPELKEIDRLHLFVQPSSDIMISQSAMNIHGRSVDWLMENGVTEEQMVITVIEKILEHFPDRTPPVALGHNVFFDLQFLDTSFQQFDIEFKFSNRVIDTNTLGTVLFDTYTSDQLFAAMGGTHRDTHGAMDDIERTVNVVRVARSLVQLAKSKQS